MKRRYNIFSFLFLSIGIIMASGFYTSIKAEAVFMNDGSIIEGKVIRDTDKIISIKPQAGPVRDIQRKDLIRVLYSDEYKNKVYIYKLDGSLVEGYIVYEDKDNYTLRENLAFPKEIILAKEKVNYISKKKVDPLIIEKKIVVEKIVEVEKKPVEEKIKLFGIDWGIGINIAFYDEKFFPPSSGIQWAFTASSLRLNIFFDFRFNITRIFSAGIETGVNIMPNILNLVDGKYPDTNWLQPKGFSSPNPFLIDIPARGFVRLGTKKFYGQIFGGGYFGILPVMYNINSGISYYEIGGEIGARLNLWGFYLEFSYIFETPLYNNFQHIRAGLGYTGRIF